MAALWSAAFGRLAQASAGVSCSNVVIQGLPAAWGTCSGTKLLAASLSCRALHRASGSTRCRCAFAAPLPAATPCSTWSTGTADPCTRCGHRAWGATMHTAGAMQLGRLQIGPVRSAQPRRVAKHASSRHQGSRGPASGRRCVVPPLSPHPGPMCRAAVRPGPPLLPGPHPAAAARPGRQPAGRGRLGAAVAARLWRLAADRRCDAGRLAGPAPFPAEAAQRRAPRAPAVFSASQRKVFVPAGTPTTLHPHCAMQACLALAAPPSLSGCAAGRRWCWSTLQRRRRTCHSCCARAAGGSRAGPRRQLCRQPPRTAATAVAARRAGRGRVLLTWQLRWQLRWQTTGGRGCRPWPLPWTRPRWCCATRWVPSISRCARCPRGQGWGQYCGKATGVPCHQLGKQWLTSYAAQVVCPLSGGRRVECTE